MLNRVLVVIVGLLGIALVFPANPFAQDSSTPTWPAPEDATAAMLNSLGRRPLDINDAQ